jgi:hypothetical protein
MKSIKRGAGERRRAALSGVVKRTESPGASLLRLSSISRSAALVLTAVRTRKIHAVAATILIATFFYGSLVEHANGSC